MRAFPDTSFLCALYRPQLNSPTADAYMEALERPLPVSTLVLLEYRQSIRLQIRLHTNDASRGYPRREGTAMLRSLQADLATGVIEVVPADWPEVHRLAETLSAKHTETQGHRLLDLLHVATALHLGAPELLTFDANQRLLAQAEGLIVPV